MKKRHLRSANKTVKHVTLAVPIEAAREIAEDYGYDQVIIVARKTGRGGVEHVTTYGINTMHCKIAAVIGQFLKFKIMGWKEETTHETRSTAKPLNAKGA